MGRYLIRRLLWGGFTMWGLVTAAFLLLRAFPGGPFDDDLALRPEIRALLESQYRISGGLLENYLHYLGSFLRGEWGVSLYFPEQTVAEIVRRSFGVTFALNASALVFAVTGGLVLGLLPHLAERFAPGIRAAKGIALALPSLFLAPLALWLLSFRWGIFPLRADGTWFSLALPVFLLALRPACAMGRLLDVRLAEARTKDFARTPRAQGAGHERVVLRWLLRLGAPSFLQQLPSLCAGLLSGSLLIEILFSIHGLGFHFSQSLLNRDWPMALGITVVFGAILILVQILVDAAIMALDPRVVLK